MDGKQKKAVCLEQERMNWKRRTIIFTLTFGFAAGLFYFNAVQETKTINKDVLKQAESGMEEQETPEEPEEPKEPEELEESEESEDTNEDLYAETYLSENETVVTSFSEFKTALESSTITTIYLGVNIVMESSGAIINALKPSLVIDGVNPQDSTGTIHTLTDYNSSTLTQTITMRSNAGPKSISLRNLILYGKNYYGTIAIYDAAVGVTLTYENIEYYGPQLVYNRYGTAHFNNVLIRIGSFGSASLAGEVGETGGVVFAGNVDIAQVEAQYNEIFYFPLQAGDIIVQSGAKVNISTYSDSGFIYSDFQTTFTARSGSEFNYTAPHRFWEAAGTMKKFTVENDAKVHLNITGSAANAVLRVLGALYVGPGAELHLLSGGGSFSALVMNGDGDAVFDDPGSVIISSPSYRAITYNTAAGISISAQQVNYWTTAGAGDFEDPPLYTWRKADESLFTLSGTISAGTSGNFTTITSNFGPEDTSAAAAPNSSNFSMVNARVISFGRIELMAEYEYMSETAARIAILTKPLAILRVSYTNAEGAEVIHDASADEGGSSFINLSGTLQDGTPITVRSNRYYLTTERLIYTVQSILQFESIPPVMIFSPASLSSRPQVIERAVSDWELVVFDSRGSGNSWTLTARLDREMTPAESDLPILEGALIFINADGDQAVLDPDTETLILEHTASDDVEIVPVGWDADKGILLTVSPESVYADTVYTGTIAWTLADVP